MKVRDGVVLVEEHVCADIATGMQETDYMVQSVFAIIVPAGNALTECAVGHVARGGSSGELGP